MVEGKYQGITLRSLKLTEPAQKPLDVTIPHMVESTKFDDMLALILMWTTPTNGIWELNRLVLWKPPTSEPMAVRVGHDDTERQGPLCQENNLTLETSGPTSDLDKIIMTLQPGDRLSCGLELSLSYEKTITLTMRDCKRWLLCAKALSKITSSMARNYPVLIYGGVLWVIDENQHMDKLEF